MSDEIKNKGAINYRSILQQTKQTFEEAEAQIKAESFSKRSELFRMSSDGDYSVRILPLVPELDAEGNVLPMDRHGFEYPVHQQFLKIELPKKKGEKKAKTISIPVVCATDKGVGKSIDLIDTYVKIANELYPDDTEILELLEKGGYNGGLKWSYIHSMYVFDLSKKGERRGPLVWNASHAQYCDLRDAKQRLWIQERERDPERDCPVCGFENAYPVNIIRKTENKTEYTIEIGRYTDNLTDEDLAKLFDAPRLPEQIYSFNRYSLEAEVEFLKQYDEKHGMDVCQEQDFLDAIETLKGELSPEDKSHFDINKSGDGKDDKDGGKGEVTVNSLWAELDAIDDAGLSEKSDEYQELREKIRQFIEDNDLDIRLSRSKNNEALIRDIEDAMEDKEKNPSKSKKAEEPEKKEEKEEKSERRSRSRRAAADDDEDDKEPEKEDEKDDEPEPEPERETRSRRRPRPSDDDEEPEKEEPAAKEAPAEEEERPARRERRRR